MAKLTKKEAIEILERYQHQVSDADGQWDDEEREGAKKDCEAFAMAIEALEKSTEKKSQ